MSNDLFLFRQTLYWLYTQEAIRGVCFTISVYSAEKPTFRKFSQKNLN